MSDINLIDSITPIPFNGHEETWVCEDASCVCHDGAVLHVSDNHDVATAHKNYMNIVRHYYDTKIGKNILTLSPEFKYRAFQMLTDYADVLEEIYKWEVGGMPILDHILGKKENRPNLATNPDYDPNYDCPIIKEYEEWKAAKNQ